MERSALCEVLLISVAVRKHSQTQKVFIALTMSFSSYPDNLFVSHVHDCHKSTHFLISLLP